MLPHATFATICRQRYPTLRMRLLKFMAIDAESGDYFLGDTMIEADTQARAKYPGKVFYVGRIGYRAAIKYHRHVPLQWGSRR